MLYKPVKKTKPFRPFVTMEQIAAFDSSKPETATPSPFVNAVIEALEQLESGGYMQIASYMQLNMKTIHEGLRIATGMEFYEFRRKLLDVQVKRLRKEHPELSAQQVAKRLGYASRASVWRVEGSSSKRSTKHSRELEQLRLLAEKDPQFQSLYESLKKKYKL